MLVNVILFIIYAILIIGCYLIYSKKLNILNIDYEVAQQTIEVLNKKNEILEKENDQLKRELDMCKETEKVIKTEKIPAKRGRKPKK